MAYAIFQINYKTGEVDVLSLDSETWEFVSNYFLMN